MKVTGDLDTRDGEAAAKFVGRMLEWKDTMLDMPINKLKKILNTPAYNGFVFVEHDWKALGKSMQWYEEQCKLVDYNEERIMREINLKRIHGSNASPFKRSDLMYLMSHVKEPIKSEDISNNLCPFNIYTNIKPNIHYILTVDPSEGLAQDNNAVTLINPHNQMPVMEFRSPYVSQPELFKMLCKFMDQYCPRCMIVIENNKGRELINLFMESKYKYNLYYDDNKLLSNISEAVDKYGAVVQSANERRAYGLSTTRSNRPKYYAILENIVEERKELLFTQYLVDDTCGLIRKVNGKVEAAPGKHDDNIMSFLMGLYIYFNAPYEVLERYGIIRGASESEDDYDENGNLTEEATMNKFRELAQNGNLPQEMQEIINATLRQRDGVSDTWDYYRQVDAARKGYDKLPSQMNEYEKMEMTNGYTQSASPLDQAFWEKYDNDILDSNDYSHTNFDIDDFLD